MVDLSYEAAHKFWFGYKDPMIYRIVAFMESVEDWTVDDDPDFEAAVQRLGKILDEVGDIGIIFVTARDTQPTGYRKSRVLFLIKLVLRTHFYIADPITLPGFDCVEAVF